MEARTDTSGRGWALWVLPLLVATAAVLALLLFHQAAAAAPGDYGPSVDTGSGFSKTFRNQCSGANREITAWYPGGPDDGKTGTSSVTVTGRYPGRPAFSTFVAVSSSDNCSRVTVDTVRVVNKDAEATPVPLPTPTVEPPDPERHRSRSSEGTGGDGRSVEVRVSDGGFIKEGKPVEIVVTETTTTIVDGNESRSVEKTYTCEGGTYYYGTHDVRDYSGNVSTQYYRTGCIEDGSGPEEGELSDGVTINDNQVKTSRITQSDEELFQELREAEDRPGTIYTVEVCNTHRRVDGNLKANVGTDSCDHEANWKIYRKVGCIADDSGTGNPFAGNVPNNTDTSRFRLGASRACTT